MVKYREVLDVLNYHHWKNPLEIASEIAERKGLESIALHGIYPHLRSMESDGFVERRERNLTPEQLSARGGRVGYEYKLTTDGIRRRSEESADSIEGCLLPAKV